MPALPPIDPTKNVLDLVHAAIKSQDLQLALVRELFEARFQHLAELGSIRAEHEARVRDIETKRLDAIRQVDVLAVSTAADRSQTAIQALAAATNNNAQILRDALTATAATIATQLSQTVTTISDRIAALEKSSYEGAGKSKGLGTGWMILLGVVGLVGSLLGIVATGAALFMALQR